MSALDDKIIKNLEQVTFDNHLALVIDPKRKAKLIFAQRKFEKVKIPSCAGWDELKRTGNGVRAFTLFALKAALKWDQTKFEDHADALLEIDSATGSGSWIDVLHDARIADALKWRTMLFRRGFKAESDAELIAKAEIQQHILIEVLEGATAEGEPSLLTKVFLNRSRLQPHEIVVFRYEGPTSGRITPLTPIGPGDRSFDPSRKELRELMAQVEGSLSRIARKGRKAKKRPLSNIPPSTRAQPFLFEPPVADFIERDELVAARDIFKPGNPLQLAFWGPLGCGKTELARKITAEFNQHFKDGIVEVRLSESGDHPLGIDQALVQIIHAFEPDRRLQSGDRVELRRVMLEVLGRAQCLLLLDDAGPDVNQLKLLLPNEASGGSVITTSRFEHQIAGFESLLVPLPQKGTSEAVIRKIIKAPKYDFSRWDKTLAEICGWNFRVIRSVASAFRAKAVPGSNAFSSFALPKWLRSIIRKEFEPINKEIASSYERLGETEKRVWRALATIGKPHFSLEAAADILKSLRLPQDAGIVLGNLRRSSRIFPHSSTIRPFPETQYIIQPIERAFLKAPSEEVDDTRTLERAHSFFFRERLLYSEATHESKLAAAGITSDHGSNRAHYLAALIWGLRRLHDKHERIAFEEYLRTRDTIARINRVVRRKSQKVTMRKVLQKDKEAIIRSQNHHNTKS